jgi:hypothetical protein
MPLYRTAGVLQDSTTPPLSISFKSIESTYSDTLDASAEDNSRRNPTNLGHGHAVHLDRCIVHYPAC